jgi:hypothetical protein
MHEYQFNLLRPVFTISIILLTYPTFFLSCRLYSFIHRFCLKTNNHTTKCPYDNFLKYKLNELALILPNFVNYFNSDFLHVYRLFHLILH